MAKYTHGKSVVTIENQYQGRERYESPSIHISSPDGGKTYSIGIGKAIALKDKLPTPIKHESNEASEPSAHEKKVQEHTNVLLDVLKRAESSKLQGEIKLMELHAEIARYKLASHTALLKVVHDALQAGVQEEEVMEYVHDNHVIYLSEVFDEVYQHTDLDNTVTTGENQSHEQNTY